MSETLKSLFDELHAERVRSWDPAKIQVNIDQRQELVDSFDPTLVIKAGDALPDFVLLDVSGDSISRDALISDGPALLIFFRFAGCPACNIALPYYQRGLWPTLEERGVRVVAVSPQVPERLIEIKARHNLGFTVASDPGNALARQLGVTYHANAATRAGGEQPGWIGEVIGTGTWELPQPTAVLIGTDGRAAFVQVSPDWLDRTEADEIIAAIDRLPVAALAS